ncbi:hypothetical protein BDV93DRAFT_566953 [Ceratobasidium sp. AG-I]|nr:hypothetical protein BDV93DRAFT_566953 [Ceratobasidium sp. AG-I]
MPNSAADLSSLQALDLRCMILDDVVTIASCIIPRQGLNMSLALGMSLAPNIDDSYIDDLSPFLPFFKRFHVARLSLEADYMPEELNLETVLGSLGEPLPSLEELALDRVLLRDSKVDGGLLAERFPRLHTLHITGESFPVDRLKMMLASSPIQTIWLRRHRRHPSEVLQAISEVVPSVLYSLYSPARWSEPFLWDLPSISYLNDGVL